MGLIVKLVLILIIPLGISYFLYDIFKDDPVPVIKDEFWGPKSESNKKEDVSIRPFKIDISESKLTDLKMRLRTELNSNTFAPPLEGIGFQYGFNTNYLKKVITYWLDKYNWTERQKYLNRYPHFKTKIGGLDIHFQHVKPKSSGGTKYKKTLPLLMVHGWPGSFVEYQKIIELFLEPKDSDINFELVIPSLPGYGFSSPSARVGMTPIVMANIFGRLMDRLGYKKYYTMGEDWGTTISTDVAILYPERYDLIRKNIRYLKSTVGVSGCIPGWFLHTGVHVSCYSIHPRDNLKQAILSLIYPSSVLTSPRSMERFYPFSKMFVTHIKESGYLHIQATKPDTVGVALSQSPSGLAAYILEKFSVWTNSDYTDKEDGGLLHKFTMDELLDNVMVYWVSGSITSSMRLYSEAFSAWNSFRIPVQTPVACTMPPNDAVYNGELSLSSKFPNLKQFTIPNEGGHFACYEIPHVIAKEALRFFNQMEKST